jgi:ribosomal subunit interface protein
MDTTITARNLDITDRFRDYATEKAEKVSHLAPKAIAFEIKLSRQSEPRGSTPEDRVELMLIGPGPLVRAESAASDKYAAFDMAFAKLLERVRQAKDRRKVHRGQHRPTSLSEASTSAASFGNTDLVPADADLIAKVATGEVPIQNTESTEEDEYSPVVIREKVFPAARMSTDDAVDHMELVGHDFFLFIDSENERPSVVYRRKGWDYGVISLSADESVPAGVSGSRAYRR